MSRFTDAVARMDAILLNTFDAGSVMWLSTTADEPVAIQAVTRPAPLIEGTPFGESNNVYLFVHQTDGVNPTVGDQIITGGNTYFVHRIEADDEGGRLLMLKQETP